MSDSSRGAQLARNSTCSNFRVLLGQQVIIIDICTERSTKGPAAFQLKHPARPGFDPLFLVAPAVTRLSAGHGDMASEYCS